MCFAGSSTLMSIGAANTAVMEKALAEVRWDIRIRGGGDGDGDDATHQVVFALEFK